MANYGEELGAWYLRLNGFFPISNFVLHHSDDLDYSADCDILAIRPPFVFEEIGGQPGDWDPALGSFVDFNEWNAVIAEVKSGATNTIKLQNEQRLAYALARLGIRSAGQSSGEMMTSKSLVIENMVVHKVLISARELEHPHFHTIKLAHTVAFIRDRFARYRQKNSDRVFFNSDLIQFLIAESEQARREVAS